MAACTLPRIVALVAALAFTQVALAAVPVLVIHGGAGVIRKDLTPEKEKRVRADLDAALDAGYAVLKSGGSSLDAVTEAILVLEDSPRFNAGKGAVFTHDGRNELDASIMDGATLRAGAVAGVHRVKNPILLARAVMEKSPHVMLVGDGAEAFARDGRHRRWSIRAYFRTEERWQQLQQALKAEQQQAGVGARPRDPLRHRRRGRARRARPSRRGDLDRRHDQQALGPRRRFADHRRRHLRQRALRRVRDRLGRVLHPRDGRARHLRARRVREARRSPRPPARWSWT